jgi:hypothetical protein
LRKEACCFRVWCWDTVVCNGRSGTLQWLLWSCSLSACASSTEYFADSDHGYCHCTLSEVGLLDLVNAVKESVRRLGLVSTAVPRPQHEAQRRGWGRREGWRGAQAAADRTLDWLQSPLVAEELSDDLVTVLWLRNTGAGRGTRSLSWRT